MQLLLPLMFFLCGLFLFSVGLIHQEIIGFESRFFLFAKEMLTQGITAFPTTYYKPYPDYPVTATILIYSTAKIFGELNKLTAILPSAFAASITLMTTYLIGALENKKVGIYAVLFLLMTNTFVVEARTISLDQYITAITAVTFYIIYSANIYQKSKRLLWLPFLIVLGFSFRGPLGLIIPTGVTISFYLCTKDFKKIVGFGGLAIFLLLICTGGLLATAYYTGGQPFMQQVLQMEILGRLTDSHMPPRDYYLIDGFAGFALTFPLVLSIIFYAFCKLFFGDKKFFANFFNLTLCAWLLIILIGLSIPSDKKLRYLLPIAPALSLLAANLFVSYPSDKIVFLIKKIFMGICIFLPAIFLILIGIYLRKNPSLDVHMYFHISELITLQIIMLLISQWHYHEIAILGLTAVTFIFIQIMLIEPINQYLNKTSLFVNAIENIRKKERAQLIFFRESPDGLPIKYMTNATSNLVPKFVANETEMADIKKPYIIIASIQNFNVLRDDMQRNIILKGKIGRKDIVVAEVIQ